MEAFSSYPATLILIVGNLIASFLALSNPGFMSQNLFHVGPILKRNEWHRTVTSGFLHGGLGHLMINMFVLWNFGSILEGQILGSSKFLLIYFASLLGGSLWALLENKDNLDYRALGASGATSGIVLSFCLFAPFAMLMIFVIPMPAIVFGIVFIVGSAILAQRENKVIGHEAHLGGALAGLLTTMLVAPEALRTFSAQVAGLFGG